MKKIISFWIVQVMVQSRIEGKEGRETVLCQFYKLRVFSSLKENPRLLLWPLAPNVYQDQKCGVLAVTCPSVLQLSALQIKNKNLLKPELSPLDFVLEKTFFFCLQTKTATYSRFNSEIFTLFKILSFPLFFCNDKLIKRKGK